MASVGHFETAICVTWITKVYPVYGPPLATLFAFNELLSVFLKSILVFQAL